MHRTLFVPLALACAPNGREPSVYRRRRTWNLSAPGDKGMTTSDSTENVCALTCPTLIKPTKVRGPEESAGADQEAKPAINSVVSRANDLYL